MYLYNVVHYVVRYYIIITLCPIGCVYTLVVRFVVSVLVAGLDCFAALWAESHLSERIVYISCIKATPDPPI